MISKPIDTIILDLKYKQFTAAFGTSPFYVDYIRYGLPNFYHYIIIAISRILDKRGPL